MISHQFEAVLVQLTRIAAALEKGLKTASVPASAHIPDSPWDSPEVPEGYDTVVGYFSRTLPSAFDLMEDPIQGTQRDSFWCTHQANVRGYSVVTVAAPAPFIEVGITHIQAFPVSLLEERIAA